MNNEEKINELEQRLVVLEKIEKRRKTVFWIKTSFKILIVLVLAYFIYRGYKTIETYKKKLDDLQKVEEKLDNTENYIQEQIDKIKDFNIFN